MPDVVLDLLAILSSLWTLSESRVLCSYQGKYAPTLGLPAALGQ